MPSNKWLGAVNSHPLPAATEINLQQVRCRSGFLKKGKLRKRRPHRAACVYVCVVVFVCVFTMGKPLLPAVLKNWQFSFIRRSYVNTSVNKILWARLRLCERKRLCARLLVSRVHLWSVWSPEGSPGARLQHLFLHRQEQDTLRLYPAA